jgi:hypothetical protein
MKKIHQNFLTIKLKKKNKQKTKNKQKHAQEMLNLDLGTLI